MFLQKFLYWYSQKKVWHIDSRKCIWYYLNVTCIPGSIAGRLLFRVTVQTQWNLLQMEPSWNYYVRRTSPLNGSMLYLRSRSGMGGNEVSKGKFLIKISKKAFCLISITWFLDIYETTSSCTSYSVKLSGILQSPELSTYHFSKFYRRLSHMDPFYNASTVWCFLSGSEIGQDHCSNLF